MSLNNWFYPQDDTRSVLEAQAHLKGKFPDGLPALPEKAVAFYLGLGMPMLEKNFETVELLDKLPGFITKTKVLGVKGHEDICFVHGGYGAPQAVTTVEALRVLGVKEIFLIGLCGGFVGDIKLGDVFLPEKILSEEGASRHYFENAETAVPNAPEPASKTADFLRGQGLTVHLKNTVTTDAPYRQTFFKEQLWRERGFSAVDMEASAVVNICNFYGMKSAVALMVSDIHPRTPSDTPWKWGGDNFDGHIENFVTACVKYVLKSDGI